MTIFKNSIQVIFLLKRSLNTDDWLLRVIKLLSNIILKKPLSKQEK